MSKDTTWEEAVLWLRAQPEKEELVRACFYDDPLLDAAKRFAETEEWQAVLRLLPKTKGRALDIGAGRGISSYALACAGWQVDALEPDASPIVGRGAIQQLIDESDLPISPIEGYAEQIPCGNEQYNLVYGRQVLHHACNLKRMCIDAARVLKTGGIFIATREHVISVKEDLPAFLADHPLHFLYGGENAFLLDEYLNAIQSAGLRIRHSFGPFDSPINYFPLTEQEWQMQVKSAFSRKIGKLLASVILADQFPLRRVIYRWLSSVFSRRDRTPGRMYSFVAVKCLGKH